MTKKSIMDPLKESLELLMKNNNGNSFAEFEDYLIPIGIRGNVFIVCGNRILNYIHEFKNDENKYELYKEIGIDFPDLNELDEEELNIVNHIKKYISKARLNDSESWIELLTSDETIENFYKGETYRVDINIIEGENTINETLSINKSLLPKGMKKKYFNNVSYIVLHPENVFILRKKFLLSTPECDNCDLEFYKIFKII